MAYMIIGSARQDEKKRYSGGAAGDSLQKSSTQDMIGEVALEKFYVHSNGWYVIRPKSVEHANAIADKMIIACNNKAIGYDQSNRLGIIEHGVESTVNTECDCSSLVRQCVREATGKDPGNFTTGNEASILHTTGLFEDKFAYESQEKTPLCNGDILVSRIKGHTCIVCSGNPRKEKKDNPVSAVKGNNAYKVIKGDTLSKIGKKTGVDWKIIAAINGLVFPYMIRVGQKLILPDSSTVKAGDKFELRGTEVFANSTGASVGRRAGTYYVYDDKVRNGRVRMTNTPARVGVKEQVSFWVNIADLK